MALETATRSALLKVARASIAGQFQGDHRLPAAGIDDPVLARPRATFVTLKQQGALRGCIGMLEPMRPLLLDVIHNARAAAFQDPRFLPLLPAELVGLAIEISVLSPAVVLSAATRAELLATLVPGRDGLILQEDTHRATFLPAVWETLPQPRDFFAQLLHKAGLPLDHWSASLKFFRYSTESFAEPAG